MSKEISTKIKIYLTTVITQNTVNFVLKKITKKSLVIKDEAAGKPVIEFLGLKSKMYKNLNMYKKRRAENRKKAF